VDHASLSLSRRLTATEAQVRSSRRRRAIGSQWGQIPRHGDAVTASRQRLRRAARGFPRRFQRLFSERCVCVLRVAV
jgi:hypothetical protein